jgi:hypothetical protein
LIVLAAVLIYGLVTNDDVLLGRLVETAVNEALLPTIGEAEEGEIITVKIANDGDIVRHGNGMSLEGELDFKGKKGDTLVFQRQGDTWVQIGKNLTEDK